MSDEFSEKELSEVKPGSLLAADVVDGRGGTLMRAGQSVEPRHVEALRRRGVKTVMLRPTAVEKDKLAAASVSGAVAAGGSLTGGNPAGRESAAASQRLQGDVARLEAMFAPYAGDPLMEELRRIAFAAVAARKEKKPT